MRRALQFEMIARAASRMLKTGITHAGARCGDEFQQSWLAQEGLKGHLAALKESYPKNAPVCPGCDIPYPHGLKSCPVCDDL